MGLQRQVASRFSSPSHTVILPRPLSTRGQTIISRSSTRKSEKRTLPGSVRPLIFRTISGDRSPPTCDLAHRNYKTHFSVSPPLPFFPSYIKCNSPVRDLILDPLHGTWSWSSFTAVIDLTVSLGGIDLGVGGGREAGKRETKRFAEIEWVSSFSCFRANKSGTSSFNSIGLKSDHLLGWFRIFMSYSRDYYYNF